MTWTDNRLQERFDSIDRRFEQVDRRFDSLERRMNEGFNRVDAEIRALRAETGAFQRTVLQLGSGMIATFVAGFAGLIATQL